MNIPPVAGSYDCIVLLWFEKHMEDWKQQGIATNRITEDALKEHVGHGFKRNKNPLSEVPLDYCAVTFFKDGTELELWSQLELGVDYV